MAQTYEVYARIPRPDEETPGEWLAVTIPEDIHKPTFTDLIEEISQHTLRELGFLFLDINCRIRVGTIDTKDLEPSEVDYYTSTQILYLDIVDDDQVENITRGGAHSTGIKLSDTCALEQIPSRKPRFVLTCCCMNSSCPKHNEPVDINEIKVPNQIDLGASVNDQRLWCKICRREQRMKIIRCLFTHCEWKYKARRPDEEVVIDSGFQRVRSGSIFDEQLIEQSRMEEWANFQIITRQIPPKDTDPPEIVPIDRQTCDICTENIQNYTESFYQTPCGHFFHRKCLDHWIRVSLKRRRRAICAYCKQPLANFPDKHTYQCWLDKI